MDFLHILARSYGFHLYFGCVKVKPVPVKRTWRRPWKKKKEREKRQPVKKARRVKRKRVVVPKKSVIHIDPRNGPMVRIRFVCAHKCFHFSLNVLHCTNHIGLIYFRVKNVNIFILNLLHSLKFFSK